MGGRAFVVRLPHAVFPRLPTEAYEAQKRALLPRIQALYRLAAVPAEAPGKRDHGDLDILTACPLRGDAAGTLAEAKAALGAEEMITSNATTNFAVPLPAFSPSVDEVRSYLQVDVIVCSDESDFERVLFHHSYGDVGLILGTVATGVGLHFGTKGLRTGTRGPTEFSPTSFELSESCDDILRFFDLSMARWKEGFQRQEDIFAWIETSRFYDAHAVVGDPKKNTSGRKDRVMYQDFVRYADEIVKTAPETARKARPSRAAVLEEALDFFGKREAYELAAVRRREEQTKVSEHQAARGVFNADKVRDWTGLDLKKDWRTVKRLMDLVRAQLGGEAAIADLDEALIEQSVRELLTKAEELARADWEAFDLKRQAKASAAATQNANTE